ncbi:MAG: outer membrane protein assembly factor [Acidobacteria bacterium]|nr:outer membrane protein assembly factor [Acidobacteriota bacterium]MBU1475247.1 outer membrane protein assembly factor [Acidobacteriota bacterium]
MTKKTIVLLCALLMCAVPLLASAAADNDADRIDTSVSYKSFTPFPILMYDTDIGIGYGGKAKMIDFLGKRESFDLILFNSSKGERWYVFTFSIPDFEIRQSKVYSLSLDVKAEYDKYLKYYYYGLGPDSSEESETSFSSEKMELELTLGRGITTQFVVEGGYVLRNIRYFDIEGGQPFSNIIGTVGDQFSPFAFLRVKYDTSNSQIHPTRGFRIMLQDDIAAGFLGNSNARYNRWTLDARKYLTLFGDRDVLAFRFLAQNIGGSDIPLFELPILGGGNVLSMMRGFKLNRFADKGKFLFCGEYRFPIWKKVGGNLFVEAGSVFPSLDGIDLGKTAMDAGWGLRYYTDDFVVRFDMGFSKESMGIYFNFGHAF